MTCRGNAQLRNNVLQKLEELNIATSKINQTKLSGDPT